MTVVLLALAGGLGAASRFLVDSEVARHHRLSFPLGTFVVNATACLLLGLLTGWTTTHAGHDALSTVVGLGFLGGYSTFSTASVEGARLLLSGRPLVGVLHPLAMLVTCLAAAAVGITITG